MSASVIDCRTGENPPYGILEGAEETYARSGALCHQARKGGYIGSRSTYTWRASSLLDFDFDLSVSGIKVAVLSPATLRFVAACQEVFSRFLATVDVLCLRVRLLALLGKCLFRLSSRLMRVSEEWFRSLRLRGPFALVWAPANLSHNLYFPKINNFQTLKNVFDASHAILESAAETVAKAGAQKAPAFLLRRSISWHHRHKSQPIKPMRKNPADLAPNRVKRILAGIPPATDSANISPASTMKTFPKIEKLIADLNEEHQPLGPTEEILVHKMAENFWLSKRASHYLVIHTMYNEGGKEEGDEDQTKQISLYLRYYTTNDRAFNKNLFDLRKLQAARREQQAKSEIGFVSQNVEPPPAPVQNPVAPPPPTAGKPVPVTPIDQTRAAKQFVPDLDRINRAVKAHFGLLGIAG